MKIQEFLSNSLIKSTDSPTSSSKTRTRNSSTCDKIPWTAWSRFYPKKKNTQKNPVETSICGSTENHQLENGFIQKKATRVIFLWLVNYPGITGQGGSWVTLISLHSSQERGDSKQTQESPHRAPRTGDAVTKKQPKSLQKGGKHWLRTRILTQASSRIVFTGITLGRVSSSI